MNIALFTFSLSSGGAERVISHLANEWAGQGNKVTLISIAGLEKDFYTLNPRVQRIALDMAGGGPSWLAPVRVVKRLCAIRREVRRANPDALISFMTTMNIMALMAMAGTGVPVIISERTNPYRQFLSWPVRLARRLCYPLASKLVSNSAGSNEYFTWMPAEKKSVILNPVVLTGDTGNRPSFIPDGKRVIVTAGRLETVKGHDLLIEAFASIAAVYPGWVLVIAGEGTERQRLEKLIDHHGLGGRVVMPGRVSDVQGLLHACDLFVLPSRYEGFPNSLIEGMACGLPCISFDCRFGPGDIIHHGRNGLLVEDGDVSALGTAMSSLMADADRRAALGNAARGIADDLEIGRIAGQWRQLVEEASR